MRYLCEKSGKQGTPRKKDMNIKTITGYQKACWTWGKTLMGGKGSNIKTPLFVRTTGHMIQESVLSKCKTITNSKGYVTCIQYVGTCTCIWMAAEWRGTGCNGTSSMDSTIQA